MALIASVSYDTPHFMSISIYLDEYDHKIVYVRFAYAILEVHELQVVIPGDLLETH